MTRVTTTTRCVAYALALLTVASAFAGRSARAQTLPASATLSVRTLDAMNAKAESRGRTVRAMVLAPLTLASRLVVAPRTVLEGTIEDAGTEQSGGSRHFVLLHFTSLLLGDSTRIPISARVTAVDNSRETVDAEGRIVGPPLPSLARAKADWAALALGTLNPIAGIVFFAATRTEAIERERHVAFAAGTDMTVRIQEDVSLPAWPAPAALDSVASDSALRSLLDTLPLRAAAAGGRAPGDFVNVVFVATEDQLRRSFGAAGWDSPDRISTKSDFELFVKAAESEGYAHQPVSKQLMFGRAPDFVFQRVTDTFAKRHHIRVWRTGANLDGLPVWAATATHDIGVKFSRAHRGFTHRTDPAIDGERNKVLFDLVAALQVDRISVVERSPAPDGVIWGAVTSDWRVAIMRLATFPESQERHIGTPGPT